MSRALPWIALALSIAALCISAFSEPPKAVDSVAKSDFYEVRDRIDELEAAVSDLSTRLDDGNSGTVIRAPSSDTSKRPAGERSTSARDRSRAEIDALNKEIAALRNQVKQMEEKPRVAPPPDGKSEEFKGAVATAQHEIRLEQMRKHRERLEQMRIEAMEEFVMAENLTPDQAAELRKIISDETEFLRMVSESIDKDGFRLTRQERTEKLESHRENRRGELERVMSREQAERFEKEVLTPPGMNFAPPPVRHESSGK